MTCTDIFTVQILRNKIGFLDARELKSDVLPVLFMDMLSDKSITRKVFGIFHLFLLYFTHTPMDIVVN